MCSRNMSQMHKLQIQSTYSDYIKGMRHNTSRCKLCQPYCRMCSHNMSHTHKLQIELIHSDDMKVMRHNTSRCKLCESWYILQNVFSWYVLQNVFSWYVTHESFVLVTGLIHGCDMNTSQIVFSMNESCHRCERVMSHMRMSHVTHVNESCHTCE